MPRPCSEEKKREWRETILRQRQSGISVVKWCLKNNITAHTFGYWRDKLFPKPLLKDSFKEIHDSSLEGTGISIHCNGVHIHLERHFDLSTLKQCLKALKELSC